MPSRSPLLYLLRHGRAAPPSPEGDDDGRALTEAGRDDASVVGRFLGGLADAPATVLSSPARRCRETAEILAARLPGRPEVVLRKELGLDGGIAAALDLARETGPGAVLVGHQPELVALAASLLDPRPAGFDLATAGLAGLALRGDRWRLALMLRPDEARALVGPG